MGQAWRSGYLEGSAVPIRSSKVFQLVDYLDQSMHSSPAGQAQLLLERDILLLLLMWETPLRGNDIGSVHKGPDGNAFIYCNHSMKNHSQTVWTDRMDMAQVIGTELWIDLFEMRHGFARHRSTNASQNSRRISEIVCGHACHCRSCSNRGSHVQSWAGVLCRVPSKRCRLYLDGKLLDPQCRLSEVSAWSRLFACMTTPPFDVKSACR